MPKCTVLPVTICTWYRHYSCIVMGYRNVRVQVPDCIEKYIKLAYPSDGKFVGFKESRTSK